MPHPVNLTGKTFGNLKFISPAPTYVSPNGRQVRRGYWLCLRCGTTFMTQNCSVTNGCTQSCGCFQLECAKRVGHANRTHGHSYKNSRTYRSWCSMKARCLNQNNPAFHRYGGCGITVCQRWIASFENFLADMGECPDGMEIDRWPDKNGNYEPGNCRWATQIQQARNKRNNIVLTVFGVTGCLSELCEHFGLNYSTVHARIANLGWSAERALCTPKLF